MSDRGAMIRAIRANRDDRHARLVYADWLDEYGATDCDRATAEYLRLCSDGNRLPSGNKFLPAPAYRWLADPGAPWNRRIGFPLPGGPALAGLPRYDVYLRERPGEEIEAPPVCNWHRLVPRLLALDVWASISDESRQSALRRGYRPTPRFYRDGRKVHIWLTTVDMDAGQLFYRSRPVVTLTFSARRLMTVRGRLDRETAALAVKALQLDFPTAELIEPARVPNEVTR